jgi:acyl-CoA synthetase (AMP-forming)/AMP-acid ligase II
VYGVPDERLGEALAATIMVRAGSTLSEDSVRNHVAGRLAAFKVPTHVFIQQENLPRIASGKIDKRSIKREVSQRLASG